MAQFEVSEVDLGRVAFITGTGGVLRLYDAMIRYYMHTNPDTLDDYQWSEQIMDLHFIRQEESKANKVK